MSFPPAVTDTIWLVLRWVLLGILLVTKATSLRMASHSARLPSVSFHVAYLNIAWPRYVSVERKNFSDNCRSEPSRLYDQLFKRRKLPTLQPHVHLSVITHSHICVEDVTTHHPFSLCLQGYCGPYTMH